MEGAATYNMVGEHSVLDKNKVKFRTTTHHSEDLLDCVHISILRPAKTVSLGGHMYFVSFIDNLSRHYWIYLMRQRCEALNMLVKMEGNNGEADR